MDERPDEKDMAKLGGFNRWWPVGNDHMFETGVIGSNVQPLMELAKLAARRNFDRMSTMNSSPPNSLNRFVDEQVAARGYRTSSEYLCVLTRTDQDRQRLRGLLLEGALSPPTEPVDGSYFEGLRERVRKAR